MQIVCGKKGIEVLSEGGKKEEEEIGANEGKLHEKIIEQSSKEQEDKELKEVEERFDKLLGEDAYLIRRLQNIRQGMHELNLRVCNQIIPAVAKDIPIHHDMLLTNLPEVPSGLNPHIEAFVTGISMSKELLGFKEVRNRRQVKKKGIFNKLFQMNKADGDYEKRQRT